MADPYGFYAAGLDSPALLAAAVTPADVDLTVVPRAIYVGTAGDLSVVMAGDVAGAGVTFRNVPEGSLLTIRVRQVRAATTAADIVALW